MTVIAAVRHDLTDMAQRSPDIDKGALAATALALATEIDGRNSATSKSMCARALLETMETLRASVPEKQEADGIDELNSRRAARIARATGA